MQKKKLDTKKIYETRRNYDPVEKNNKEEQIRDDPDVEPQMTQMLNHRWPSCQTTGDPDVEQLVAPLSKLTSGVLSMTEWNIWQGAGEKSEHT